MTQSTITQKSQYQGKLKRLSEVKSDADMPRIEGAQWVGGLCMLVGAVQTVGQIQGARCLFIGPQACLRNVAQNAEGVSSTGSRLSKSETYYWLLPTLAQDAALGQDQQIAEAITTIVEKYAPPFLFVVTTCVEEILGVDVESIIASLGDLSPTHVLVVHVDSFTWSNHTPAVERTLSSLIKAMPPPKRKDEATINILGSRLPRNFGELGKVLTKAGVQSLSAIPSRATAESISHAPEARANLVLEHTGLELARQMKERFDVDYLEALRPYGLYTTREWYEKIGTFLGLNLEIEDLFLAVKKRVEKVAEVTAGKSFALGACFSPQTFEFVRFLIEELGMEPKVIVWSTEAERGQEHRDAILNRGFDPILVHGNHFVVEPLIKEIRPDLLLGADLSFLNESGIAWVPHTSGTGYYGFEETMYALNAIERALRPAGVQVGRHECCLP